MSSQTAHDDDEPLSIWQARLLKSQEKTAALVKDGGDTSDAKAHTAIYEKSTAPPRPLIDQVSNKWRDEKDTTVHLGDLEKHDDHVAGFCDVDDEDSCPNASYAYVSTRRGRKMVLIYLVLALLALYAWREYLRPSPSADGDLREGFLAQTDDPGSFGAARGGDFLHGKHKILTLPPHLLPGNPSDPHGTRRLIFIGDIHGCKTELGALLSTLNFSPQSDHLIATGDVISKGPDSPGVLDELIRLNATSVRGNHEDRILASAPHILALPADSEEQLDLFGGNKWARKDAKLLRKLHPHHIHYLHAMPLILRIPPLPLAKKPSSKKSSPLSEEILVVHAGLVPAVPLERQDPYFVMNMRSLHPRSHVPSSEHADKKKKNGKHNKPWTDIWNYYNDHLFRHRSLTGFRQFDRPAQRGEGGEGWFRGVWQSADEWTFWGFASGSKEKEKPRAQVVVYGHDSKSGLRLRRWTKGLDSGCVGGGRLTAMVLDARGETEVVSVPCKEHY